jgi:hypothetical protein
MWGLWASAARASAFKKRAYVHTKPTTQNEAAKTGDRRSMRQNGERTDKLICLGRTTCLGSTARGVTFSPPHRYSISYRGRECCCGRFM